MKFILVTSILTFLALAWSSSTFATESPIDTQGKSAEQADRLFSDALVLIRENKPSDACILLEQAQKLKPASAAIRCNLGLAYQQKGELNLALKEFNEALLLDGNMQEVLINMAACYQSLGMYKESIARYEEFLKKFPKSPDATLVSDSVTALKSIKDQCLPDENGTDYLVNTLSRNRWPEGRTMKVFVANATGINGFRENFPRLLCQAFDAWIKASGNKLSYALVAKQDVADIVCEWTDDPKAIAGGTSERGAAYISHRDGIIQHATINILTTPVVNLGQLSDTAMMKACLHEVGHALGIDGHSSNNHDVMYATVDSPTVESVLSERDRATIHRLYQDYPEIKPVQPSPKS